MKYDVLTLDTQIFYGNGFDLDAGYLGQLKQFKTGPTRVILSSVVAREVRKQLAEKIRETKDDFESAMRRAHKYGLRSPADGAVKLIDGAPGELAQQRVKDYIEAVGATLVPVGLVSVEDVSRPGQRGHRDRVQGQQPRRRGHLGRSRNLAAKTADYQKPLSRAGEFSRSRADLRTVDVGLVCTGCARQA